MRGLHLAVVVLGAALCCATLSAIAGDSGDTVRTTFKVEGMHCDGCSATIVGTLKRVDGVVSASADHEKGTAEATYRPNDTTPDDLKAAIERLGYKVTGVETAPIEHERT